MIRRLRTKSEAEVTGIDIPPLKKRSSPMKAGAARVEDKLKEPSPRKTRNKEARGDIHAQSKSIDNEKGSSFALKINRVKAKAVPAATKDNKLRASKRVADPEEGDETPESKANSRIKKRKTKEEKNNDAMPLAARTSIASLKHAMHIGAHVSAAGGEWFPRINHVVTNLLRLYCRCPKFRHQCASNWK